MALSKFLTKAKEIETEAKQRKAEGPAKHAEEGEEVWLVSYADMMTLLCGFFIMMFSMSKVDEPKYERVKESVAQQFGGVYKSPTADLAKFVTQVIEESGVEKDITVKSDALGVSVAFQSAIFFDSASSEVRDEGKKVLEKLIAGVAARQVESGKQYRIVIEGHTDGTPVVGGVFPSNWELSSARAARVVRMFLDKGFPAKKLAAIGYADTHPEMPERTPAGVRDPVALAKNRRVVVRILEPTVDGIPTPDAAVPSTPTGESVSEGPTLRAPAEAESAVQAPVVDVISMERIETPSK